MVAEDEDIMAGKVPENSGRLEVDSVLRDATDYATRSLESVVSQLEDDSASPDQLFYSYVKLLHGLEVHYLFPNLTDPERNLVTSLLSARSELLMALKKAEQVGSTPSPGPRDRTLSHLKNRFADLSGQLQQSGLLSRLTPVQRQILEREFLSLPGSMGGTADSSA